MKKKLGGKDNDLGFEDRMKMTTHLNDICCLCCDEASGIVATGSSEKFIKVWDLRNRQQVKIFEESESGINDLVFMQKGKVLVSAAGKGKPENNLSFWEIETGLVLKRRCFEFKIASISLIEKEAVIVLCSLDKTLKLISTENLETLHTIYSNSWIKQVTITFSNIFGFSESTVKAWNILNLDSTFVVPINLTSCSLFSSYVDTIVWSFNSEILYFDPDTNDSGQIVFHEYRIVLLKALGSKFVSGSSDCLIVFWDFLSKSCYWKMKMNAVNLNAGILFDKNAIVCADIYRSLRIVDENGSLEFSGHKFEITCCNMGINKELIVTGSRDCSVRVWDFSSKIQLFVLNAHFLTVSCVCFSASNKYVVSGSFDCSLINWKLEDQSVKHIYTHLFGKIEKLIPIKNSEKLIALDENGNISQLCLETCTYQFLQSHSNTPIKSIVLSKSEKFCICSIDNLLLKLIKIV